MKAKILHQTPHLHCMHSPAVGRIPRSRNSLERSWEERVWLERALSRVAWEMNLIQYAALPWDSITLSSKWVQVNVCGMLTKGSVKPLQDKAMSWLTCQWKISTNWPPSVFTPVFPFFSHSPLFRKEAQCFSTVFGMKDNSIKWVLPPAK